MVKAKAIKEEFKVGTDISCSETVHQRNVW